MWIRPNLRFFRATAYMLSAHMLSQFRPSVRLSVCLSVTRVIHAKTVEVRILQFPPYSSPIPLVFEIQKGSPRARALNESGVGKIRNFQPISRSISETVRDRTKVTVYD